MYKNWGTTEAVGSPLLPFSSLLLCPTGAAVHAHNRYRELFALPTWV